MVPGAILDRPNPKYVAIMRADFGSWLLFLCCGYLFRSNPVMAEILHCNKHSPQQSGFTAKRIYNFNCVLQSEKILSTNN